MYNRENELIKKIALSINNIKRIENNYSLLNLSDIINLKKALSGINNIATYKVTIASLDWACKYFNISENVKQDCLKKINETSPNANGFDIIIHDKNKQILIEVKAIIPINNGKKYVAMQKASILNDAIKLLYGKKSLKDTKDYYKIITVLEIPDVTDNAIKDILKEVNSKSIDPNRIKRNEVVSKLLKIPQQIKNLSKDRVYIVPIKIE
jgi:hypothetical protein